MYLHVETIPYHRFLLDFDSWLVRVWAFFLFSHMAVTTLTHLLPTVFSAQFYFYSSLHGAWDLWVLIRRSGASRTESSNLWHEQCEEFLLIALTVNRVVVFDCLWASRRIRLCYVFTMLRKFMFNVETHERDMFNDEELNNDASQESMFKLLNMQKCSSRRMISKQYKA